MFTALMRVAGKHKLCKRSSVQAIYFHKFFQSMSHQCACAIKKWNLINATDLTGILLNLRADCTFSLVNIEIQNVMKFASELCFKTVKVRSKNELSLVIAVRFASRETVKHSANIFGCLAVVETILRYIGMRNSRHRWYQENFLSRLGNPVPEPRTSLGLFTLFRRPLVFQVSN